MPFKIIPNANRYQLQNQTTKKIVPTKYKTKASAVSAAKNFIMYREGKPSVYRRQQSVVVPVGRRTRR